VSALHSAPAGPANLPADLAESPVHHDSLFIGGAFVAPSSQERIEVISASTEQVIGSVPSAQPVDVDRAVAAARAAFDDPSGWSHWPAEDRAQAMERLAAAIEASADSIVRLVGAQNGMPISVARQLEAVFPPLLLRYYADLARSSNADEVRSGLLGGSTLVLRRPLGVVAGIVPWNFPQTLAAFKYAPALAVGCTVVLKPSPETVLDAWIFADAVQRAGLPPGVVNIVPGDKALGAYLVAHPDIDKVAFTGSTVAGRSIAEVCGKLLRPVTLELGGKSACIVLDDAELQLETIAEKLYGATLLNNGQTCFLGTRVLAPRSRYSEVVDLVTEMARSLKVGDALDASTQIGPMATRRQRERVEEYIAKGRDGGARLTVGGGRPAGITKGWFVEPTVFANLDNDHVVAREEIFGPVLCVIPYDGDEEAIRIANDSDYGLGGTVWTSDHSRGVDVAKRIHTGTIGVNTYVPEPTAPFGGVKASGMGRELGPEALMNYQTLKSIYL
jgi:aldehyde dehydrogenase (NAD+)